MPIGALNDPLNGAEIKQIVIAKVNEILNRDSTLIDDIAYAGFESDFEIRLRFKRASTKDTLAWGKVAEGSLESSADDPDDAPVESVSLHGTYETDSPGAARDEHGLPHPVLIPGPDGPRRERVVIPDIKRAPSRRRSES